MTTTIEPATGDTPRERPGIVSATPLVPPSERDAAEFANVAGRESPAESSSGVSDVPVLEAPSPAGRVDAAAWRCVDVVASLAVVVILAPVLVLVGILVKRSSPGPVFFRQIRVGRGGREFKVWKFRTMQDGTHQTVLADPALRAEYENNDFKMQEDDPRITKIGKKLRKSSIDELPQLINVIKGEMSLVGVRPLLPQELALRSDYDRSLYERYRPGVTGLWQVEGRSNVKAIQRIELDRRYLEHWSSWTNLKLILQTPRAVLLGNGAK
jgi:lipopolysaccharide/colanic/teichoic acid biosynthesis glycosyltransferase